ncbi:piggyBac transposable element-derived protein 3-like isoform X2 [Gigantopelta aegis]|nr:piggyBac transposable element-derived protein 3-like isoform X2 [Gigantopelta aegis]
MALTHPTLLKISLNIMGSHGENMASGRITRRFFTVSDVLDQVLADNEDVDNIILLPPEEDGDVTDDDENEGDTAPHDVPGIVEADIQVTGEEADSKVGDTEQVTPAKKLKMNVIWKENSEDISEMPRKDIGKLCEQHPELVDKSPYELFMMYFSEILDHLVCETNRYAARQNDHTFNIKEDDMKRFCGIFLLSGYHTLPQQYMYWCTDEDVGVPLISSAMPRNRFKEIKKYLHMADNDKLVEKDKYGEI